MQIWARKGRAVAMDIQGVETTRRQDDEPERRRDYLMALQRCGGVSVKAEAVWLVSLDARPGKRQTRHPNINYYSSKPSPAQRVKVVFLSPQRGIAKCSARKRE